MARAALSREAVVEIALGLVDEEGEPGLTLSAVAARAGVATPSLYKHVRNLAELRELVSIRIMGEIADEVGAAVLGRSGDEAVRALMESWRSYVLRHPRRYSAMLQTPDPGLAEAGSRLVGIVLAALRAYGLSDSAAIHAARCVRAAVHGFSMLETGGGFGLPEKLDESYDLLIDVMTSGLSTPR
ncbi:TetR/AcrR family transcriptional regulator [Nonomuraea terrae]|uniref:TetR/AcrR family transcriptional regulator n=1 Tax=Nonomuraea terrae TaxID=2530383 RepID=A0A4R4YBT7_9ACTN|nr:TetR/AcrR family transcriptional regulator [Nonomuraea terrae]TDD41946.1 TetR/AcrR family transcriptional regulator [Nonomuraea terrae]